MGWAAVDTANAAVDTAIAAVDTAAAAAVAAAAADDDDDDDDDATGGPYRANIIIYEVKAGRGLIKLCQLIEEGLFADLALATLSNHE